MRWTETDHSRFEARRQQPAAGAPRKRKAKPSQRWEASEAEVHEGVWQHIVLRRRPGVVAYHVPNGDLRHPTVAARLSRAGVVAGTPDLAFVIDGRAYFLEL